MAFIDATPFNDWFVFELVIDILFFLDILVNCFSAYLDEEGNLISNRRQILITYAQSWFFLDVMACFPFWLFESEDE